MSTTDAESAQLSFNPIGSAVMADDVKAPTLEHLLDLARQAAQLGTTLDGAARLLQAAPLAEYAPHFDVTAVAQVHQLRDRMVLCLDELPGVGLAFYNKPSQYDHRGRTTNYCVQMRLRHEQWTPHFAFSLLTGALDDFLLGACIDRGIRTLMSAKHEWWKNTTARQLTILDPVAGGFATLATLVDSATLARALDFIRWSDGKPLFAIAAT